MNPTHPTSQSLKAAEGLVVSFCETAGIPYSEVSSDVPKIAALIDTHTNLKALLRIKESAEIVLKGFEEGVFVRSVKSDHESGWAVNLLPYIGALAALDRDLRTALSEVEEG